MPIDEATLALWTLAQTQARCHYCERPAMEFLRHAVCADHRIKELDVLQNQPPQPLDTRR